MWIDSHAHLYEYSDEQLCQVLDEARSCSVSRVVSTAVSIETSRVVVHQSASFSELFGAVGISPFDTASLHDDWPSDVASFIPQKNIIAVGEIGIDGSNPAYPPLTQQIPVFIRQLQMAKEANIPAIIHSRGVEEQALSLCKEIGIKKAVFHCFTGDRKSLHMIIDEGFMISLSGIITFKNAAVRELLADIPLEQLLIETDAPYLTPVPFRGKKNTPSMVHLVGEAIAALLRKQPESVADQIHRNFTHLFHSI